MNEELEQSIRDEQKQVENIQRKMTARIVMGSPQLIDALFDIATNTEEDAKVRLTAIGMLMDRSHPRLGVEHAEKSELEESASSKSMRAEIESLIKGKEEE